MHGDVVAAARVLYSMPEGARDQVITQLLQESVWANRHRKTCGRVHPVWGDGSLMSAALNRRPVAEPSLSDADYCDCMARVFEALISWRKEPGVSHPRRSGCRSEPSGQVQAV
jgi:hypothetical protein